MMPQFKPSTPAGHAGLAAFYIALIFVVMDAVIEPRVLIQDWKDLMGAMGLANFMISMRFVVVVNKAYKLGWEPKPVSPMWPLLFVSSLLLMHFIAYTLTKDGMPDLFAVGQGKESMALIVAIVASYSAVHHYSYSMYAWLKSR